MFELEQQQLAFGRFSSWLSIASHETGDSPLMTCFSFYFIVQQQQQQRITKLILI